MPRSASPTSESAPPVSPDIAVEAVRTCTHVRMHAHPCAACTQAPAALKPSRLFAYTLGTYCANQIRSGVAPASAVALLQVWPAAHTQHSTCNTQHSTCNTQHATLNMQPAARNTQHSNMQRAAHAAKSRRASPVSAAALPQVGLPVRWLPVHVCRWEWSACDEPVFAADNRCVLAQCGTGPQLQ